MTTRWRCPVCDATWPEAGYCAACGHEDAVPRAMGEYMARMAEVQRPLLAEIMSARLPGYVPGYDANGSEVE